MFITADVTVTPNTNEIRDYKWVNKVELQSMFDNTCALAVSPAEKRIIIDRFDIANSFTPWFKLIARDFLFGWWDELLRRRGEDGLVHAKSLVGVADGSQVIRMA